MKYLALFIFTAFFFACSESDKQTQYSHQLTRENIIEFYGGPKLHPTCKRVYYFESKGNRTLAYVNRSHELLFFSLDNQKKIHSIKYKNDGPNHISNIGGMYIPSMDSIFLLTADQNYIILSDSLGNIRSRIKVPQIKDNDHFSTPLPIIHQINNPVIKINNKLYFSTMLNGVTDPDKLSKTSTGFIYDLQSESFDLFNINYPNTESIPWDGKWIFSRVYDNEKWVYSFLFSNKLMIVDQNGNYEVASGKSRFAKKKPSMPDHHSTNSMKEALKPRYTSLIYDKWKDLFYRVYLTSPDIKGNITDDQLWALIENPPCFSVIILSKDLEIIGEKRMPKNSYNPEMFFVNEEGIHFALHLKHPDFNPDYLKFARFNIEKLNNK